MMIKNKPKAVLTSIKEIWNIYHRAREGKCLKSQLRFSSTCLGLNNDWALPTSRLWHSKKQLGCVRSPQKSTSRFCYQARQSQYLTSETHEGLNLPIKHFDSSMFKVSCLLNTEKNVLTNNGMLSRHVCKNSVKMIVNPASTVSIRSFSTNLLHPTQESKRPTILSGVSTSPWYNTSVRHVGRSSRNQDENSASFSNPKVAKFQERTRQNFKKRVSRLRAQVTYHNRYIQEQLSSQRIKGSAVVGRLSKRLEVKKENIKTIPNLLTTLRMASAPALAYLVVNDHFGIAFSVFLVAGVTDMLDGYIARNFKNQKSALGTALDPLADKLLMCFLTVSLTAANLIPLPMTVLILSRDAGLIAASFYIRYISLAPPKTLSRYFDVSHVTAKLYPSTISKINTGLQLMYVASTLAAPVFDYVGHPLLQGLMYITAATTFLSGADYMVTWRRRLKIIKNN